MRHLQCLIAAVAALVVFSIAQNDDFTSIVKMSAFTNEQVTRSKIDRIIQRRAAAGSNISDSLGKLFDVACEIYRKLRACVTADDGRFVLWPDYARDKLNC